MPSAALETLFSVGEIPFYRAYTYQSAKWIRQFRPKCQASFPADLFLLTESYNQAARHSHQSVQHKASNVQEKLLVHSLCGYSIMQRNPLAWTSERRGLLQQSTPPKAFPTATRILFHIAYILHRAMPQETAGFAQSDRDPSPHHESLSLLDRHHNRRQSE